MWRQNCLRTLLKVFRRHMRNLVQSVKNHAEMRKITTAATLTAVPKDKQQWVIQFLMLENVSGSEKQVRMCIVYGTHNVITKSTVNRWVQRFKAG